MIQFSKFDKMYKSAALKNSVNFQEELTQNHKTYDNEYYLKPVIRNKILKVIKENRY